MLGTINLCKNLVEIKLPKANYKKAESTHDFIKDYEKFRYRNRRFLSRDIFSGNYYDFLSEKCKEKTN